MQLILMLPVYEKLYLSLWKDGGPFFVQFTQSYKQAKGVTNTSL